MTGTLRCAALATAVVVLLAGRFAQAQQKSEKKDQSQVKRAVAVLAPVGDSGVHGVVYFDQEGEKLEISGKIIGLDPGKHGFHVHEYGDLTDVKQGESAGGHYGPRGMPHGRPEDQKRHVGDFGNITADENGVAVIDMTDSVAKLNGRHSILGRALVVHKGEDKFTQPSGDAGPRAAFGVIGIAQPPKSKPE